MLYMYTILCSSRRFTNLNQTLSQAPNVAAVAHSLCTSVDSGDAPPCGNRSRPEADS